MSIEVSINQDFEERGVSRQELIGFRQRLL